MMLQFAAIGEAGENATIPEKTRDSGISDLVLV